MSKFRLWSEPDRDGEQFQCGDVELIKQFGDAPPHVKITEWSTREVYRVNEEDLKKFAGDILKLIKR